MTAGADMARGQLVAGGRMLARAGLLPGAAAMLAAGVTASLTIALMLLVVIAGAGGLSPYSSGQPATTEPADPPSALALAEIPPLYLRLYEGAAHRYGLDWAILAGIGKVECDHGRAPDPSCTQAGAVNSAGAGGPMQFLGSTWAQYGVDAEGAGVPDRWNPADAIYAAANYLRASGAPQSYQAAIYAYNHASWYVADVESWAARYRSSGFSHPVAPLPRGRGPVGAEGTSGEGAPGAGGRAGTGIGSDRPTGADTWLLGETPTPVRFVAGERALLEPDDGHVALIPAGVPATVQAMVVAGNELQDLPYGPGGHPDPAGASEEDCSSTVNYVLYRSGVRPLAEIVKDNPLAQNYVGWGAPGPGRWVTIYATDIPTPHVLIVIAGLRLDTSHDGTDVGPNAAENGPRWRILGYIPTWAHWSVRHPPGL